MDTSDLFYGRQAGGAHPLAANYYEIGEFNLSPYSLTRTYTPSMGQIIIQYCILYLSYPTMLLGAAVREPSSLADEWNGRGF